MNLYVDIEAIGNPNAVSLLGPVKAAGNLKDPAKIAADIAEKEAKRFDRAALDCDTLQIVAIGVQGVNPEPYVMAGSDERAMLEEFWSLVREWEHEAQLVGYNCLAYDLPALIRRSQMLGVPYPSLNVGKYRHAGIIDLMQVMTWDGLVEAKSLSTYCRLFGLDVPEDASTGADIAALYAAGDWDAIRHHCASDVTKTRLLYERVCR